MNSDCNAGKGNWDDTDWRPGPSDRYGTDEAIANHMRAIGLE